MKGSAYWLGWLAALCLPSAEAVNQEIRALFQPDSSQPNKNVFVNKTPNSGYCANYPGQCFDNNMFSIQIPVQFSSTRALVPGDALGVKAPANWRRLTVTNRDTQEAETVEVRIVGIGSNFFLSDSAANLTGVTNILEGHQKLWTSSSWVYAPSPCEYSGVGAYGPASYLFFWKSPVEAACSKVAAYRIPSMYFDTLNFAYELRTPNPLGMSSGLYTGSLSYSLGPGGDFQMGPMMVPDDNNLTLDFVLDVQHVLKVDIPPGGDKVVLEPPGGWQSWLDQGRHPVRLFRDQLFHISASSRFTMKLECEDRLNNGCAVSDHQPPSTYKAEVTVSVSLPDGMTDSSGRPVRNLPVTHVPTGVIHVGTYVDRKPGTLHFNMNAQHTKFVIDNYGDRPFKGNFTVIWDSEV
ncbi:hypothetical protein [Pseudomonas bananamidigenes]|uniref:hypothetical protein n=1 Tax=Pseudomonas bananamidigenes TaxID=2843610 RepID=UPI0008039196|nr:hypothetical protein [Pseudomonas bananamidigenes]